MLLDIITKGATDVEVELTILDSTTSLPKTDVVFNSAGIALWYRRQGSAKVDITEATLAALTTPHTDGGFLHNSDGKYRLDLPDAAAATGAGFVDVGGTVTGGVIIGGRLKLRDPDPLQINTAFVNFPFPMRLSATGAPATGVTVTVQRSIDGGAYATIGTATEVSVGTYEIDFSAADRNGKAIKVLCTAPGCYDNEFTLLTTPAW